MPPEFLMQQMELREALDEAASAEALDQIDHQTLSLRRDLLSKMEHQIDAEADWPAAAASVRAMMFLDRLADEIERKRGQAERLG